jgi:hypothetical protein
MSDSRIDIMLFTVVQAQDAEGAQNALTTIGPFIYPASKHRGFSSAGVMQPS